jgi:serine/threonine-protein kinase
MALTIGTQLGTYEITALLGKGGMGEVYRARDTKLKREVAIKILPDEFSRDPARVSRFQREAELLASLNHPNISGIYDLQEANGTHFLVLELVEGETLAERIQRGRILFEQALGIAHQIAEACEAAHEKGVIHRDLKPGNVKITPEGKVKVLDFGLAKALDAAPAQSASNSPTLLSTAATNGGVILGTAGYMSPEQAKGHSVDQRSDIFSFGCVLFEMLTGRQAFQSETVTETIAAVLMRDPDFTAIPANLHPKVEELVRRCLVKNRKERWHAIADVRVELETIMADPLGLKVAQRRHARPLWKTVFLPAMIAAIVASAATAVFLRNSQPTASAIVTRFAFVPEAQLFLSRSAVAISPDGTTIVFAGGQPRQLYMRNMGDMEVKAIPGTDSQNPQLPFFSPDGRWVGFVAPGDNTLKKIAITGGVAVSICDVPVVNSIFGPTWNSDDYIYIGEPAQVVRCSANGGKPEMVVELKPAEASQRPQLLPGGDALLFTVGTSSGRSGLDRWANAQIVVQSLKTGERKVLIPAGSEARYVPTGHIVYMLGSALMAVRFDVSKLQVTSGPVSILDGVQRAIQAGGADAQFAFSNNGSMIYIPGTASVANIVSLVLVDRSGTQRLLNIPPGQYSAPRISPNGSQLAVELDEGKEAHILIYDLNNKIPIHKLTSEGVNVTPLWTTDSQRVVFTSERDDGWSLLWQRVDGGPAEQLAKPLKSDARPLPDSWSPDGKVLLFTERTGAPGSSGSGGISAITPGGDGKPKPVIKQNATYAASLSPDGRWLAYSQVDSRGRNEVYVEPFPPTGEKHQISSDRGSNPLWSRNGNQLFYMRGGQIIAVDVQTQPSFSAGKVTVLPIGEIVNPGPRPYDVTPDGKYFVVMLLKTETDPSNAPRDQINVILNWFRELQERLPLK